MKRFFGHYRSGRWGLISLLLHGALLFAWIAVWEQEEELEPEPIEITLLKEQVEEIPKAQPRKRLKFYRPSHRRIRESLEIPREIMALTPPPEDVLLEPEAIGGGLSLESRFSRSHIALPLGGSGRGGVGSGVGMGNAAAATGTFQEYLGGLRQTGLDIVFVIDATKSMDWLIEEVRNRVKRLSGWVRGFVPTTRFGIVAFRDYDAPEFVTRVRSLTLSNNKIRRFITDLETRGGGDIPEAVSAGLDDAIKNAGWKAKSKKVIILIGDASPKEPSRAVSLAAQFHANGGTITTLDLSFGANPKLAARQLGVSTAQLRTMIPQGSLPSFRDIASAGGGDAATLEGDLRVIRHLAILIFGERWEDDVRPLLGNL